MAVLVDFFFYPYLVFFVFEFLSVSVSYKWERDFLFHFISKLVFTSSTVYIQLPVNKYWGK